jgi:hypothetical protein
MKAGSMRSSKYHHKKFRGKMKGLGNLFPLWSLGPQSEFDQPVFPMRRDRRLRLKGSTGILAVGEIVRRNLKNGIDSHPG